MVTKTITGQAILQRLISLVLGGVFVFAGAHKILDPGEFAVIIYGYDLLPNFSIPPLAVLLPFLELFCGLALIFRVWPRGGVLLINIMLMVFIIAISINLIRGHQFECGCFAFSTESTASAVQLLIRDIILLLGGGYLLWADPGKKKPATSSALL